jgi:hypothetical protein
MITEGTYSAQLVKNDGEWLQFSYAGSGNAQVLLTFELEGGQHMQGFFSITPAAAEYTLQKLHNCGFKGESFKDMLKQTPHGKCDLVVVMDEYKGKTRPKIKFINRQGGFSIKPEDRLNDDDLDRLSKMITPASAFGASTNAQDDDIPF